MRFLSPKTLVMFSPNFLKDMEVDVYGYYLGYESGISVLVLQSISFCPTFIEYLPCAGHNVSQALVSPSGSSALKFC